MKKFLLILCCAGFAVHSIANDTLDSDLLLEDISGDLIDLEELSEPTLPGTAIPDAAIPEIIENTDVETPAADETPETPDAAPVENQNVKINVVNVDETFFKLEFNSETNVYTRSQTNEAKPGDLIEIVINAVNASDETVTDVELINTVPQGPLRLVDNSFQTDLTNSLYRISRNGQDFFPSDAGLESASIRYIQWVVFSLTPGQQIEFKYRIQINQ